MNLSKNTISLLFVFVFVSFTELKTQNLIMNPNFEDENICRENNSPCAPAGWLSVTTTMPTYNINEGKFIRMLIFNTNGKNRRDYIQTQFLCDLKKEEEYIISLRVKQDECIISSMGILISDQFYIRNKSELLDVSPTIDLTSEFEKISQKSQKNWVTISVNYIAKGGEKFILIGNFQKDQDQKRKFIKDEKDFVDYKLVLDDVTVTKVDTDTLCPDANDIRSTWYKYDKRHSEITFLPYVPKENDSATIPITTEIIKKTDSITLQDIIFEFNSFELTKEAKNEIMEIFKNKDFNSLLEIHIEGHTDNVGQENYNLDLSQKRAESVKALLTEIGIDENIISTEGKGDQFPIEDNSTEEGRKANRRIEIRVSYN